MSFIIEKNVLYAYKNKNIFNDLKSFRVKYYTYVRILYKTVPLIIKLSIFVKNISIMVTGCLKLILYLNLKY